MNNQRVRKFIASLGIAVMLVTNVGSNLAPAVVYAESVEEQQEEPQEEQQEPEVQEEAPAEEIQEEPPAEEQPAAEEPAPEQPAEERRQSILKKQARISRG